jgi:hypothetical protein
MTLSLHHRHALALKFLLLHVGIMVWLHDQRWSARQQPDLMEVVPLWWQTGGLDEEVGEGAQQVIHEVSLGGYKCWGVGEGGCQPFVRAHDAHCG